MRALLLSLPLLLAACGDNQTPPSRGKYVGGDATPLACAPNLDGRVDASELAPAVDVNVGYLINPLGKERPVDVVGTVDGGKRTFRFDLDYADDQKLDVKASAVAGKWYAESFPTAGFVAPLDAAGTLDGIYRHDDAGVHLLGIASKVESPPEGKTLLVYAAPVTVFRFPLVAGSKWVSTGTVTNGTIRGLPYAGKDVYEVEDDATGTLVLHDFTFDQVHRVRTKVTVSPSVGPVTMRRQVSFIAECFGEVVRVVSKNDEPSADFTVATELRRLGQ